LALDEQVDTIAAVQVQALVGQRQRSVCDECNVIEREFIRQAALVGGLQQPGSEVPVDLDRTADYPLDKRTRNEDHETESCKWHARI
jgi:hypothetical protein